METQSANYSSDQLSTHIGHDKNIRDRIKQQNALSPIRFHKNENKIIEYDFW